MCRPALGAEPEIRLKAAKLLPRKPTSALNATRALITQSLRLKKTTLQPSGPTGMKMKSRRVTGATSKEGDDGPHKAREPDTPLAPRIIPCQTPTIAESRLSK